MRLGACSSRMRRLKESDSPAPSYSQIIDLANGLLPATEVEPPAHTSVN